MFKKIRNLIDSLNKARQELNTENKLSKSLQKQNKDLLKTIEAYKKQGSILSFESLDEDLIKKLQSLTEDNIIIIYTKTGERIEIKQDKIEYYNRRSGGIY